MSKEILKFEFVEAQISETGKQIKIIFDIKEEIKNGNDYFNCLNQKVKEIETYLKSKE